MFTSFKKNKNFLDENEQLRKETENINPSPTISIKYLTLENEKLDKEIFYLEKIIEKSSEGKRILNVCLVNKEVFLIRKDLGIM